MKISQDLANEIVHQLKGVIEYDINFIDQDAIVIASTDPSRVGDFHGAGELAMKKQDIVISYTNHDYPGSRQGVDLPIIMDDSCIGAIGITGEVDKVISYGYVVQKMTEILVKEQIYQDNLKNKIILYKNIIQYILFPNTQLTNINFNYINNLLASDQRGLIFIFSKKLNTKNIQHVEEALYKNTDNFIFSVDNTRIISLYGRTNQADIKQLYSIVENCLQPYKLKVKLYVGDTASNTKDFSKSINQAKKTYTWYSNKKHDQISYFSDLDIGLLLTQVDKNTLVEYFKRILGEIPESELEHYHKIFRSYEANNKSIQKAADSLYMHKNTYQYQLDKIYEYTGYNPRLMEDSAVLSLAFHILEMLGYSFVSS